jgi:hypothetical protein
MRTPYDGKPFYCALCGLGFGEMMACEEPDCQPETEAAAKARQKAAPKDKVTKEAKLLAFGDLVRMDDNTIRTVKEVTHGFALFLKGSDQKRSVIIWWQEGDWSQAERDFKVEIVPGD